MNEVKRIERGWAGHFCCSDRCLFRRNTLLEYKDKAIVISTIGNLLDALEPGKFIEVGAGRDYETMAFYVDVSSGEYKDADVSNQIDFESKCALKRHKNEYIDNEANDMHEAVVTELTDKLLKGVI